ncbi:MAG TPA: hypothetical protein VEJ63_17550 [Planctomycetota bacterium]|nr:hypothetical protein [Planctomycetota bacterium]
MDVSLCFDVEDYTSPPEAGMDDIPKWNAEIMTQEGVRGSFLVIGGKARSLRQRERFDVISAMAKHEIGVHTMFGSEHPTMTEAMAPLEFRDAVQLGIEREGACYRDLKEIFKVEPGSFSSHGASQVPAMHYVAGKHFDRPWLYSFVPTNSDGFCWYANCLQLRWSGIHISEAAYSNPKAVDETLARWDKLIDDMVAKGYKWSNLFLAHPLMIRARQFNDGINFPDGKTRVPYRTPELRTMDEMKIAQEQFRRVIQYIAKHPKLQVRTLFETYQKYGKRKPSITRAELKVYAEHAKEGGIPTGYMFSPGDALVALGSDLRAGKIADRNPIGDVLGPTAEPSRAPDNGFEYVGAEEIKGIASRLVDLTAKNIHLPDAVVTPSGGGRMGLPSVLAVLAEAWLQLEAGQPQKVRVPILTGRYPNGALEIEANARRAWMGWPIHDINMPLENISRQARLQSWTWKRAWDGTDTAKRFEPLKADQPID